MVAAKSPEHIALGLALRTFRSERGISQEQLSFLADLHRNYVGQCERGEINLSFGVMLKLMAALDIGFADLANRYEEVRARTISSSPRPLEPHPAFGQAQATD